MNLLAYDYSISLDESFSIQMLAEEGLALLDSVHEHQQTVCVPLTTATMNSDGVHRLLAPWPSYLTVLGHLSLSMYDTLNYIREVLALTHVEKGLVCC